MASRTIEELAERLGWQVDWFWPSVDAAAAETRRIAADIQAGGSWLDRRLTRSEQELPQLPFTGYTVESFRNLAAPPPFYKTTDSPTGGTRIFPKTALEHWVKSRILSQQLPDQDYGLIRWPEPMAEVDYAVLLDAIVDWATGEKRRRFHDMFLQKVKTYGEDRQEYIDFLQAGDLRSARETLQAIAIRCGQPVTAKDQSHIDYVLYVNRCQGEIMRWQEETRSKGVLNYFPF